MNPDDREPFEVLKTELNFIEKGGYGRSVRFPRRPTSLFQDSLICLNYADSKRGHPCSACLLFAFVPPSKRNEDVPCHHIPLNDYEETIEDLECESERAIEDAVKGWLRATIKRLEKERTA